MDLTKIKDPSFLKDMQIKELEDLANEIRSFIIEKVSKTGGHLSSNLGVVELTIALHYVFNSPEDKIIFDVGHQSYVHKILTGRAIDFDKLRKYKGLSGYQKRNESIHDVWEAGHSSTALSAVAGFEIANLEKGIKNKTIAVVGDGSLNSGLSFEALNYLGHYKGIAPIIILNDNEMSISKNVGRMSKLLNKLRSSKMYVKAASSKTRAPKFIYNWKVRLSNMIRGFAGNISLFDELGFSYYGPIDGHDIKSIIKFLNIAKKRRKPIVIHVVTKKGKGYLPAENDSLGTWHGVSTFDIETGKITDKNNGKLITWSRIFSRHIESYAKKHDNFRVIVPAMIYGSDLVKFQKKYPKNIIDVGICESFAVCFSASLALNDMMVYIPIYSSFLQRAYDQVSHDLARQDLKVVIGIDRAGLVGSDGETHQGIYDIAYLRHIPNIEIVQPSNYREAKMLLDYAFYQAKHSVAIRYSRGTSLIQNLDNLTPITKATWNKHLHNGLANLIAYGDNFKRLYDHIKKNELPINIYNALFIKPFDTKVVDEIFNSELPTYVLEDVTKLGGLGSSLLEYATDKNYTIKNFHILGLPDEFIEQGTVKQIYKQYGLDTESIIKTILK